MYLSVNLQLNPGTKIYENNPGIKDQIFQSYLSLPEHHVQSILFISTGGKPYIFASQLFSPPGSNKIFTNMLAVEILYTIIDPW